MGPLFYENAFEAKIRFVNLLLFAIDKSSPALVISVSEYQKTVIVRINKQSKIIWFIG